VRWGRGYKDSTTSIITNVGVVVVFVCVVVVIVVIIIVVIITTTTTTTTITTVVLRQGYRSSRRCWRSRWARCRAGPANA
jgi:multisubunit Na+/H+ antiporter MnhG subunit